MELKQIWEEALKIIKEAAQAAERHKKWNILCH